MCTTYMYSLKFLEFWRKKAALHKGMKMYLSAAYSKHVLFPCFVVASFKWQSENCTLGYQLSSTNCQIMGTLIIKKKNEFKRVNCEGIYYKMDWLWNLEKKAFHSFCIVREAFSPIHWNDVPAHQNTQSSAIKPSYVHEWVTVSIKISWTYFVFIYQMQEIYISLASPICFL